VQVGSPRQKGRDSSRRDDAEQLTVACHRQKAHCPASATKRHFRHSTSVPRPTYAHTLRTQKTSAVVRPIRWSAPCVQMITRCVGSSWGWCAAYPWRNLPTHG